MGLKLGGVLNVVRSEVELMCPATAIPEKLVVDLEGLNVGDTINTLVQLICQKIVLLLLQIEMMEI